ncbi:hypothetical protein CLOSBL3_20232 [Clostridiaceae bacterium BL-3]|nr:hypothetical protein CLOSBL3_20232 [Clostridiaceae bacterium BL-3]
MASKDKKEFMKDLKYVHKAPTDLNILHDTSANHTYCSDYISQYFLLSYSLCLIFPESAAYLILWTYIV